MSFESDLYTVLSVAAVTALVSDRIVPSHMSEGSLPPYIVYTPIFDDRRYDLDGETNLSKVRTQIDCYAEDPDTAASIAEAVIAAIPETGWPLHRTAHSEQDLGLEPDTRLFRRMLEFSIFHRG